MRVVVIGAGGVGGTIGGRLHQAGYDVALVARGAHGEAVRTHGLVLATPEERLTLQIPTYATASEVTWTPDDVVVLAVKSQDTEAVARDVATAAGPAVPVVSAQNGVANERMLSRWFDDVHGFCVMLPAEHLEPGIVVAGCSPTSGILDLGRFPGGSDHVDDELAAMLRASRFESVARPDIMRWKYRKLLNNLGNAVEALCGHELDDEDARSVLELVEGEAARAFAAAGVEPVTEAEDRERRADHLRLLPVAGADRGGGSTWQSLARGSGIETDYLNGEIALLGRLHDVPTPANSALQAMMTAAAARGARPGELTAERLLGEVRA